MANPNELLIKINADANSALKTFEDIGKASEKLSSGLAAAGVVAAAAFAALSGEIIYSAERFTEGRISANELTQALQNQGMFTVELRDHYLEVAEALSSKNEIDKDQIVHAEAIAQSFLSQTKVTKELTQVIIDYAAKYGQTIPEAASHVARAIGTSSDALVRQGIELKYAYTEQQRMNEVVRQGSVQFGGWAEQIKNAGLGTKGLSIAVDELQKTIGEQFAPEIKAVNTELANFVNAVRQHPEVVKMAAALIAGAAAAAAFATAAIAFAGALTLVSIAAEALEIEFGTLAVTMGGIPLVIGAIVAGVFYLSTNWESSMLKIRAASAGAVAFLSDIFAGLREVMKGALFLDGDEVKEGFAKIKEAASAGYEAYNATIKEGEAKIAATKAAGKEKQQADKAAAAAKNRADKAAKAAAAAAYRAANSQLKLLQIRQADKEEIALQQEKVALLKDLETEQDKVVVAAAQRRLQTLALLQAEQSQQDKQRAVQFAKEKNDTLAQLARDGYTQIDAVGQQELNKLRDTVQTETQVENAEAAKRLQAKIAADNLYLADQKKFGTAYAAINKLMHSEIYNGTKSAFANLADLQNSSNSTLKAIGKAAAIANIAIKTAEAAVNIFEGFSTIPIVGPELGVAGAAVAVAYGAEQIANVTAASSGAYVTGGTAGRDSVPYLLEPGELVAPAKSFDQVVDGVKTERSGVLDKLSRALDGGALGQQGSGGVTINIHGDMLADDSYIDRMAQALGHAVQFRNTSILGVTA